MDKSGLPVDLKQPRPKFYSGTLSQLRANNRKWLSYEFIIPSDSPLTVYRGTVAGTIFSDLEPFATGTFKPKKISASNTIAATSTLLTTQVRSGVIVTTAAGANTQTLPTVALMVAGTVAQRGTTADLIVDNSTAVGAVTIAVGTGGSIATAVITGSDNMVVGANKVGIFRIYFTSLTTYVVSRIM